MRLGTKDYKKLAILTLLLIIPTSIIGPVGWILGILCIFCYAKGFEKNNLLK
jgi:hypothetical protein